MNPWIFAIFYPRKGEGRWGVVEAQFCQSVPTLALPLKGREFKALALLLALAACSQTQECIRYIECPDHDCTSQAQALCPKGYSVMSDAEVGADFSDFAKQHFAGAAEGVPHIVVQCNP